MKLAEEFHASCGSRFVEILATREVKTLSVHGKLAMRVQKRISSAFGERLSDTT